VSRPRDGLSGGRLVGVVTLGLLAIIAVILVLAGAGKPACVTRAIAARTSLCSSRRPSRPTRAATPGTATRGSAAASAL
jgi:hypothetical protein